MHFVVKSPGDLARPRMDMREWYQPGEGETSIGLGAGSRNLPKDQKCRDARPAGTGASSSCVSRTRDASKVERLEGCTAIHQDTCRR